MNDKRNFCFNFGPISRTLGEEGNYLGFASLPVHEAVTTLLGARDREEFLSWLWHDAFKALFTWESKRNGEPGWFHIPAGADNANLAPKFNQFAQTLSINPRLAKFHHARSSNMLKESEVITSEFSALHLGKKARFVQLSFACQPTAHTFPLRQCVTEAFLRAVSQVVARDVQAFNLPFDQVLYSFKPHPGLLNSARIAAKYDMNLQDETLHLIHWVPSDRFEAVDLRLNLKHAPPQREEADTLALIELLTVYRDELTLIIAVPLFMGDPDPVVRKIKTAMEESLPDILEQAGIQTQSSKVATDDLENLILEQMTEVRKVAEGENEQCQVVYQGNITTVYRKPIHKLIRRPYQLMAEPSRQGHTCVVCGSPITSDAAECHRGSPRLRNIFSSNFTSFEYVGFDGDVCPLCLTYAINSSKRLRGAQAFLAPSTALSAPVDSELIEQPRFDNAGRFDRNQSIPKATVTLLEMVLLTLISRRVVDKIVPFEIIDNSELVNEVQMTRQTKKKTKTTSVGIHLPYTGTYLIYHQTAVRTLYRETLVGIDPAAFDLWQPAQLRAYPFRLKITPAFMLFISMRDNASNFHTRHTLLKSHPTQVFLSPTASFNVLIDDTVQETINQELSETIHLLDQLSGEMKYKERREFIKALLAGHDPVEAVYLAVNIRKGEVARFNQALHFWNREEVAAGETAEEQWQKFTQFSERVQTLVQAHPTLLSLI